jgi:hypothetical protein
MRRRGRDQHEEPVPPDDGNVQPARARDEGWARFDELPASQERVPRSRVDVPETTTEWERTVLWQVLSLPNEHTDTQSVVMYRHGYDGFRDVRVLGEMTDEERDNLVIEDQSETFLLATTDKDVQRGALRADLDAFNRGDANDARLFSAAVQHLDSSVADLGASASRGRREVAELDIETAFDALERLGAEASDGVTRLAAQEFMRQAAAGLVHHVKSDRDVDESSWKSDFPGIRERMQRLLDGPDAAADQPSDEGPAQRAPKQGLLGSQGTLGESVAAYERGELQAASLYAQAKTLLEGSVQELTSLGVRGDLTGTMIEGAVSALQRLKASEDSETQERVRGYLDEVAPALASHLGGADQIPERVRDLLGEERLGGLSGKVTDSGSGDGSASGQTGGGSNPTSTGTESTDGTDAPRGGAEGSDDNGSASDDRGANEQSCADGRSEGSGTENKGEPEPSDSGSEDAGEANEPGSEDGASTVPTDEKAPKEERVSEEVDSEVEEVGDLDTTDSEVETMDEGPEADHAEEEPTKVEETGMQADSAAIEETPMTEEEQQQPTMPIAPDVLPLPETPRPEKSVRPIITPEMLRGLDLDQPIVVDVEELGRRMAEEALSDPVVSEGNGLPGTPAADAEVESPEEPAKAADTRVETNEEGPAKADGAEVETEESLPVEEIQAPDSEPTRSEEGEEGPQFMSLLAIGEPNTGKSLPLHVLHEEALRRLEEAEVDKSAATDVETPGNRPDPQILDAQATEVETTEEEPVKADDTTLETTEEEPAKADDTMVESTEEEPAKADDNEVEATEDETRPEGSGSAQPLRRQGAITVTVDVTEVPAEEDKRTDEPAKPTGEPERDDDVETEDDVEAEDQVETDDDFEAEDDVDAEEEVVQDEQAEVDDDLEGDDEL